LIRSPLYLCISNDSDEQAAQLDEELAAMVAAGLTVEDVPGVPQLREVRRALRLDNQAQFNPSAYVRGLAAAIASDQCRIYEHSHVLEFDAEEGWVRTGTATVRARHIVFATHTPIGVSLLHAGLGPYREYGIAA
jgi:glycine/D-amino acid oxidase-like deaminating enzyme